MTIGILKSRDHPTNTVSGKIIPHEILFVCGICHAALVTLVSHCILQYSIIMLELGCSTRYVPPQHTVKHRRSTHLGFERYLSIPHGIALYKIHEIPFYE